MCTSKDLKKELVGLRNDATKLPSMIMSDFDAARSKAVKQLEFFGSSQSSDIRGQYGSGFPQRAYDLYCVLKLFLALSFFLSV